MAKKAKEQNENPATPAENNAAAPAEQIEQPAAEDKSAELEKELNAEKDKYLRLLAEYDNYRKRSQKEREALYDDIRADTIVKLLPVYDNLQRALALECADAAFRKGVEMIMTQTQEIFAKLGVTEIPALGEEFDPTVHNAVMHVEDADAGENIIVEEFQKGFKLGGKVIRVSMVKVAN